MIKQVYEVDINGYLKEIHVEDIEKTQHIILDPPQGLYRAKWVGTEWIEEGTPPEPQQEKPTEIEILKERLEATELALIELMMEG